MRLLILDFYYPGNLNRHISTVSKSTCVWGLFKQVFLRVFSNYCFVSLRVNKMLDDANVYIFRYLVICQDKLSIMTFNISFYYFRYHIKFYTTDTIKITLLKRRFQYKKWIHYFIYILIVCSFFYLKSKSYFQLYIVLTCWKETNDIMYEIWNLPKTLVSI